MTASLLIISLLALTAAAALGSVRHGWQWRYQVWMPPVYQRLAWCESGSRPPHDPVWSHRGGEYEGAFGFWHGTWLEYRYRGYPLHAYDASPWQQFRVAVRLRGLFGWSPWGCARYRWVTG